MPTDRPRMTITLTPSLHHSLTIASKALKRSKSSFILELLEQSQPFLEAAAVVQQGLGRVSDAERQKILNQLANFETAAGAIRDAGLGGLDLFFGLHPQATDRPNPPPPNRGGSSVSNPVPKPKKGTKTASNVVSLKARKAIRNKENAR